MSFNDLHCAAVEIVGRYRRAEAELIDILQEIDQARSYRAFGCASLFVYAVEKLGLSEDVAYNFINVARKALEVPGLKAAIANAEITVSKAKKITSVITPENQSRWLAMAKALPQKKLEKEVARVNPKAATQDRATYVTDKRMQLTLGLSEELMERFRRVQDLECQKRRKPVDFEETLQALVNLYLGEKDPMQKTQVKLVARLAEEESALLPSGKNSDRLKPPPTTLTPARKQFVLRMHGGRCTRLSADGRRCRARRWLDVHHLKERSRGGTNAIKNLTVLCAEHHRQAHAAEDEPPPQ